MITDSRYFSFKLIHADINAMKSGSVMKVAGKFSTLGWETRSIDLSGFSSAYGKMCD